MNERRQIKEIRFVPNSQTSWFVRFVRLPLFSVLLSVLAGWFIVLSLAPYHHWYVTIPAVMWIIHVLETFPRRKALFCAFAFALGMWTTGIYWIYYSIFIYGNAGVVFTPILVGLLCLLFAFLFLICAYIYCVLVKNSGMFGYIQVPFLYKALCFSALWVLQEWLREYVFHFPWLQIGNLAVDSPLTEWLPLVGVYGSSYILVLFASSAYFSLTAMMTYIRSNTTTQKILPALLCAVVLALVSVGLYLLQPQWTQEDDRTMRMALVQPNIPLDEKWRSGNTPDSIGTLTKLSQQVDADVHIWPESAIAARLQNVRQYVDIAQKSLQPASLVTGSLRSNNLRTKTFNSIVVFDNQEGNKIYDKQTLVPFGEYIPFVRYLRFLLHIIGLPELGLSVGNASNPVVDINGFVALSSICYEIAFSQAIASMSATADFLLTISDDGWFGNTIGPEQHFQIARVRAKESGRYMVRVANDGITALIDAHGTIIDRLPRKTADVLVAEVPATNGVTPYTHIGYLLLIPLICFPPLFCLSFHFLNRRKISIDENV